MKKGETNAFLPPWHVVERAIKKEQKWLITALDFGFEHELIKPEKFLSAARGKKKDLFT